MQDSSPKGELVFQIRPGRLFLLGGLVAPIVGTMLYFDSADPVQKWLGALCILSAPIGLARGILRWRRPFNCYRGGLESGGRFVAYNGREKRERKRVGTIKQGEKNGSELLNKSFCKVAV